MPPALSDLVDKYNEMQKRSPCCTKGATLALQEALLYRGSRHYTHDGITERAPYGNPQSATAFGP